MTITAKHMNDMATRLKGCKPVRSEYKTNLEYVAAMNVWLVIVDEMSTMLSLDNPRFNPEFFERACGLK